MIISHRHFDLLDKTILERVVFQPPATFDSTMRDEACFMHIIQGNARLYAPKDQVNIYTKDSLVMKCGTYLNKWLQNEEDVPNEAVLVHLYPDVLKAVYEDQLPDFFSAPKIPNQGPVEKVQLNNMISNYVQSLMFYFENPSLVSEELIKIKVKEIVLLLVHSENSERISSILSDLFYPSQYKFKEVIHAHLFENLSLQDLAVLTGYSLSSFKRKFKTIFGTSPHQYIKRQRLEKSKELLLQTDLRVSDVAYDCGFNDIGHFSKSFIAAYQIPPTEYRKRWQQQLQ